MPNLMPITNKATVAYILRGSKNICLTWLWQQTKQAVYNVYKNEEKVKKLGNYFPNIWSYYEKRPSLIGRTSYHLSLLSATLSFFGKVIVLEKVITYTSSFHNEGLLQMYSVP